MNTFEEKFTSAVLRAWRGELPFPELMETAALLDGQGQGPLAIVLYQTWLTRTESPYAHAINFNLGVSLSNENDLPGAQAAYLRAIQMAPAFIQPRLNLGMLYERMGQVDKALVEWRWVAHNVPPATPESKTMVLMALNNLGRVLDTQKQFLDAMGFLTRSLTLDPQQSDVVHHWVHLRQKQCVWPVYAPLDGVSTDAMQESTSALAMLSVTDDPAVQLAAARRFVSKKVLSNVPTLAPPHGYQHRKLRIAYASSDLCMHPVALLTAELFELHDRSQFEVYAFCWSPEDGSAMRQRIIRAMDHFIRIDTLSDEAAARLIREHEIDVLIDLQGQTSGARANMLAYRPAPIQITYLGLPATTGLPSIDYVIADRFLIPEAIAPFYSEKPLYMPDMYQVSDRKRTVGSLPSRESCGLPVQGFVFCSLNNNYKFTPEVFEVWMRILQRTPGSVLWLLSDNPWAEANLQREAEARGVDKARILFAHRVSPDNYLARFTAADLFLDTFPFNAGTTANDALWMGLPVLTYCGRAFASRMAGALLTAAGMDDLITYSLQDYEEKAVALATQPGACAALKARLQAVHNDGVLFDTARFTRNLELQLQALCEQL